MKARMADGLDLLGIDWTDVARGAANVLSAAGGAVTSATKPATVSPSASPAPASPLRTAAPVPAHGSSFDSDGSLAVSERNRNIALGVGAGVFGTVILGTLSILLWR